MVKKQIQNECKRKHKNRARTTMDNNIQYMRYLRIPPTQNKYLIINIINNTLMTHLTSFKNTLSKRKIEPLTQPHTKYINKDKELL